MMDLITKMVSENANISKEQSQKAIEAVLAFITHECGENGEAVNKIVIASNASSAGGLGIDGGGSILDAYKENYGSLEEKLKAANV